MTNYNNNDNYNNMGPLNYKHTMRENNMRERTKSMQVALK